MTRRAEPATDEGGGLVGASGSPSRDPRPDDEAAAAGQALRIRLDLGYDGTGFSGWARQPGRRTVQGVLEDALARLLRVREPVSLTVAGRTDAGVHARGQVAHLDLDPPVWAALPGRSNASPGQSLVRRLAGLLPPDVRVGHAVVAASGFDARFSALSRRYAYRIADGPSGVDPLQRHFVLEHRRPLDEAAMNAAAQRLLGEHDFAAFCRRRKGASTVRALLELSWTRSPEGLLVGTVRADAFCHSMVRSLVGALIAVGEGRRDVEWPAQVLAGGQRVSGASVVAAHGLTLEEVAYPPDEKLARRAEQARQVRGPLYLSDS